MAEWNVRVLGPTHQIEAAVQFLSGYEWAMRQEGDGWYLRSERGTVEGNGAAIAAEAEQEISRVNLLYELYNPGQNALLSLGEHYFFTEGRGRNYFLSVAATIQTERGSSRVLEQEDGKKITEIIWTVPVVTVVPYAAAHRKLCRDPDLETVVAAFLHHPEDWTQIAKVLELVEVRCGGEIPRNWVSRTELELLRRTANSFAEAGRTGRHALPRYRATRCCPGTRSK